MTSRSVTSYPHRDWKNFLLRMVSSFSLFRRILLSKRSLFFLDLFRTTTAHFLSTNLTHTNYTLPLKRALGSRCRRLCIPMIVHGLFIYLSSTALLYFLRLFILLFHEDRPSYARLRFRLPVRVRLWQDQSPGRNSSQKVYFGIFKELCYAPSTPIDY